MPDLTDAKLDELERAEKAASQAPIGSVTDRRYENFLRNAAPRLLAEIRRLRAIIAKTHEDYCVPYKLGEGERRHSTECLLFELTTPPSAAGEPQP